MRCAVRLRRPAAVTGVLTLQCPGPSFLIQEGRAHEWHASSKQQPTDHKVSKHWLKRSVEARINDANRDEGTIPETSAELERYAEDTQSTILYMTLQAGGIQSTVADHAASHIGKASGLLLLLKALPHHVNKQGTVPYIPASVAEECGLLTREGGRSEVRMDERLPDAVFKVASVAEAHLQKARELASSVPKEAIPVLLPALPAQVLLDTLRKITSCGINRKQKVSSREHLE
ncbi:uncharacterized protein [Miscanthus floridulus]|uniref:uncharacterized protein n=1 Tax=Miscanthus floridulus TaxID=154761 RepID=UPI003458315B